MIYPNWIKKGDTIGVTAPSDGNRKEMDFNRLNLAIDHIQQKEYHVFETENVRQSDGRGRSSSKEERAKQFMQLIQDPSVTFIISAKGGDFLMEILPNLDYNIIQSNPKWFQGFSDNTGLTYTITTNCDIATSYSNHFNDFAMKPWHDSVQNNFDIMTGKEVSQKTFSKYEDGFYDKETPFEGYHEDKVSSQYAVLDENDISCVTVRGRLLGGCLDVLLNLVGTSFDQTAAFVNKYSSDGILWYLESFSLDTDSITRGLWQLMNAGWFEHATGFVFGRPCMYESFTDHTYREAVCDVLSQLHVPIIFDADIGHKSPQFTMINGALGEWSLKDGKSIFNMTFL